LKTFRQYLPTDLENDEEFYKGAICTFIVKVSIDSELQRKEEELPSPVRIKQLKACWIKIIKSLKEMLVDCDIVSVKKWDLYLKLIEVDLVGSIGDVEDPHLILNSILMSKKQFEEKMDLLKAESNKRFNNLIEYSKL
jgi:hypothetical protein